MISKTIAIRGLFSLAFIMAFCATEAQTIPEGTEQILVRVHEGGTQFVSSTINIAYGNNQSESKTILYPVKAANREENAKKINEVLYNIRKAGFKLETSHAGGNQAVMISTYLFIKE